MKKTLSLLLIAATSVSFYSQKSMAQTKDPLDLSGRDLKVSPAQNFFEYANGTWIKNTKIPEDQTGWGSFYIVRNQALANMKSILDDCLKSKDPKEGSITQQVGALYASALDSDAINKAGIQPLEGKLNEIRAINSPSALLQYIAKQNQTGDGYLFSFYIAPDDKNSNVERPQFMQGGLGLPNQTYYFKQDQKSEEIRNAYINYITTILKLTNFDNSETVQDARGIMSLEVMLAKDSKTPVELRDPEANYHLLTIAGISKIAPNFDWGVLLKQLRVNQDTILVGQPDFFKTASEMLQSVPIKIWQQYLVFHLVSSYAPWLSKPFEEAHFGFYNKLLNGQQVPEARWKRAASLTNGTLGDALGQLYVKKFFPPEAKTYMINLVHNLQKAYAQKIKDADWLSEPTKKKAIEKLEAFTLKIGYPDKWKNYSSIKITKDNLIANLENIGKWEYDYDLNKLGKPTDKTEWQMTPPTVNAYYNPSFNEIVFPAGILQPPFYFQHGDDAVNYGAIGFVIGHEMTHGFDDQGSLYDKNGNLHDWWTKEDREKYNKRAQKIVDQYSNYVVLDSVHVNGKLTEGENLADNGGLAIAYAAFKMTKEGKSTKEIDGLTPDQRFFMSAAQVWRIKTRPQRMLWRINNDPHSPEMYRVNGPMSNMPAFYKAFKVKPGDEMYRTEDLRAKIW